MANTTNFGWETPDDTDLVKDGAAAIRTLGSSIDTSFVDLKGGTTGQVLSKTSNTDLDFTWVAQDDSNAIQNAIVDAKGDLISATAADTPARLAVGTDGQVLQADSTTATGLKWTTPSSGALTWTQRLGGENFNTYTIGYNGSNLYVVAGSNGRLFTSPDGITWTQRTSGFGTQIIRKVIYANSLWVAVGANGLISTSSDGITWTARTANMSTNAIRDVYYANSLFVAVGTGGGNTNTGGITYSSDGITWTRKSQIINVNTTYYCVIYNGTNWIIGLGYSGGLPNNVITASTPSGTWTPGLVSGTNEDIVGLWYDGTRTIGTSTSYWIHSTSTTLATATQLENVQPSGTTDSNNLAFYYNGKMYQKQNGYLMDFSTTPGTTTTFTSTKGNVTIEPGAYIGNAALNYSNAGGILVNASGIVIGGIGGQIYTSF